MGWRDAPLADGGGWQSAPLAQDEEGPFQAALIGAGKTFTQLGRGVQQAYYGITGDQQSQDALKAKVADEEKLYKPLADAHPWATGIGEGLPVLAGGPVTMGLAGGLEYGTPQEKALRAGGGFVGGKLGEFGGKMIGRALQPVRSVMADAGQTLFDKFSATGLPGQITGSKPLQWIEQTIANLPGGGRIRDIAAKQQSALDSATMGKIGSAADAVTPETVAAAKTELGKVFNTVPAGQTVQITPSTANRLAGVEAEHFKNLSPDQRSIVRQYVDDILSHGENGMPGDVYQKARSRIAARANSTQDSELKTALTGIYKTLDDAFDKSASPEAVAAMKKVRGQWQTAKQVEKMANVSGNVSPARMSNAAKNLPADARDLAEMGQRMKGLPDSGTAQRLFYQSLLSGGAGLGAGVGRSQRGRVQP